MNRYTVYQVVASFSIAFLIVSVSFALLAMNRGIYKICLDRYYESMPENGSGEDDEITKKDIITMKLSYFSS